MLHHEHNRPLKPLTTFKIGGPARIFAEITDPHDLPEAFRYADEHHLTTLVLGGGSNMLISDRGCDGMVIQIGNRGIEKITNYELRITNGIRNEELGIRNKNQSDVPNSSFLIPNCLRVASGEVWDDVVKFAVANHLWGIENLSRIPGRTGAVAVQNVGAYGPEIKDFLVNVEVYDRKTNEFRTLTNEECCFGYRTSIFNTTEKNRYIILYTTLRLSTGPIRNLSYPDVKKRFENNPEPSQEEIRQAIKEIRDRKFPFPAESIEGNAGSFFKNSVLTAEAYDDLERHFVRNQPEHLDRLQQIRHKFPSNEGIKIPSAFILEACGLKGYHRGDVMLNPTQPVVVLNVSGEATADEVLSVVREVRTIVEEKTGLHLYTEPELIGFTEEELRWYGFNDAEIARYII